MTTETKQKKTKKTPKPVERSEDAKKQILSPEQKNVLFKQAKKVRKLKDVKNPVKGEIFKMTSDPKKKGDNKDGRSKNLGKQETIYRATGKKGFGKWEIITSRRKPGLL